MTLKLSQQLRNIPLRKYFQTQPPTAWITAFVSPFVVTNQYSAALNLYLQAGAVCSDFFTKAVPPDIYTDQVKHRDYTRVHSIVSLCSFRDMRADWLAWQWHTCFYFRFWRGWLNAVQCWTATHRSEVKLPIWESELTLAAEELMNIFCFAVFPSIISWIKARKLLVPSLNI